AVVAKIEAPANLAGLAWLSPNSFAYLTLYYQVLKVVEQKQPGVWAEIHDFGQIFSGPGSAGNLVGTSTRSVAWSNGTNIWSFDFSSSAPQMIWEGTAGNTLQALSSLEGGEILLQCRDDRGQFLIRFDPARRRANGTERIEDPKHLIPTLTLNH